MQPPEFRQNHFHALLMLLQIPVFLLGAWRVAVVCGWKNVAFALFVVVWTAAHGAVLSRLLAVRCHFDDAGLWYLTLLGWKHMRWTDVDGLWCDRLYLKLQCGSHLHLIHLHSFREPERVVEYVTERLVASNPDRWKAPVCPPSQHVPPGTR